MRSIILVLALALVACGPTAPPASDGSTPVVSAVPGADAVCSTIDASKLDLALRAYDAALDAINVLATTPVLKPGSARAIAVANANDRVLAAFKAADAAHKACNATSYSAALNAAQAAIADVRAAIHSGG